MIADTRAIEKFPIGGTAGRPRRARCPRRLDVLGLGVRLSGSRLDVRFGIRRSPASGPVPGARAPVGAVGSTGTDPSGAAPSGAVGAVSGTSTCPAPASLIGRSGSAR